MIYLDSAATTPLSPKVLEAMMPYLKEEYGNAGAIYRFGRRSADAIAKARRQVADFVGATPEQIIFTSGGTEANNLAILGCKNYLNKTSKRHIITSKSEHDSVLKSVEAMCGCSYGANPTDFYTTFIPVNIYGQVIIRALQQNINNHRDIGLVSIMHMNNEVGAINDITSIGNICRKNNILFHTDCVQSAGSIKLNVNAIGCDFMSISSHKIHGPKGVGALYIRDKNYISALINGGDEQEFGLRGGTQNVAGIVGFGEACALATEGLRDYVSTVIYYKKIFFDTLHERLLKYNLNNITKVNSSCSLPGKTLSLTFKNIDAETLVLMLDSKNVYVSAGSACRSRESHPSQALLAMGLTPDEARSTIRVSFSEFNKVCEVEEAAKICASCVKTLWDASNV